MTDPKKAASALEWAVVEMQSRLQKFAERGVRDLKGFNKALKPGEKPMPQIVIIIDELADLMLATPGEVEDSICRLGASLRARRACTWSSPRSARPSTSYGRHQGEHPTRISFLVASQVDSKNHHRPRRRGKLLGYGDMLFVPSGIQKPHARAGARGCLTRKCTPWSNTSRRDTKPPTTRT